MLSPVQLFVCLCRPLLLLLLCPAASGTPFDAGTYILTQKALDDAPERYTAWVQDALQYMDAYKLPDYSESSHCGVDIHLYSSRMTKTFSLAPGSLKLAIIDSGFEVSAEVLVTGKSPVEGKGCKKILFWCTCPVHCGPTITFTMKGAVVISAKVQKDTSGRFVVVGQPVAPIDMKLHTDMHCSLSWFAKILSWMGLIKTNFDSELTKALNKEVTRIIDQTINAPQVVQPYPPYPIFVTYSVMDLAFVAGQYAQANASAVLTATSIATGTNVTWATSDPGATCFPPGVWDRSSGSGASLRWLLNSVRLSSTALTGLVWAGHTIGAFLYDANASVLDANITTNMTWTDPLFSVHEKDKLNFTVVNGSIMSVCETCGPHYNEPLLDFRFTTLTGSGNLTVDGDYPPGIVLEIEELDLSKCNISLTAPKFPVPETMLHTILKDVIASEVPLFNEWAITHPLVLPPQFAPLIPNPLVHLYPQPSCPSGHGFLELSSFCSCSSKEGREEAVQARPLPYRCNFKCGTATAQQAEPLRAQVPATAPARPLQAIAATAAATATRPSPPQSFSLTIFNSFNTANRNCALGLTGQTMVVSELLVTGGLCRPALDGSGQFYTVELTPDGRSLAHVALGCDNRTCTDCIIVLDYPQLDRCYEASESSVIIRALSAADGDALCVGPAVEDPNSTAIAVVGFLHPGCVDNASSAISVQTLGEAGDRAACSQADALDPQSFFTFDIRTTPSGRVASAALQCNAQCRNCGLVLANQPVGACGLPTNGTAGASDVSYRLLAVSGLDACGARPQHAVSPGRLGLYIGAALGVLVVAALLAALVWWCATRRRRAAFRSSVESDPYFSQRVRARLAGVDARAHGLAEGCWRGVLSALRFAARAGAALGRLAVSASRSTGTFCKATFRVPPLPSRTPWYEQCHILMALVAAVLLCWHALAWRLQDPFEVFSQNTLGELDVPREYLDPTRIITQLKGWSALGSSTTGIAGLATGALTLLSPALRRSAFLRLAFRNLALTVAFLGYVGVLLLPPFEIVFRDGLAVEAGNSTWLQKDPSMRSALGSIVGYGFAGVSYSFVANILLFVLHGLAMGVSLGAYLFEACSLPGVASRAVLYHQIARVRLLLWFAQLAQPLLCILPAIVVYQSLGVIRWWAFLWFGWWAYSFLAVAALVALQHRVAWNSARKPWLILALAAAHVVGFAGCTWFLLSAEHELRHADVMFPARCVATSAALIAALVFGGLHRKLLADQGLSGEGGPGGRGAGGLAWDGGEGMADSKNLRSCSAYWAMALGCLRTFWADLGARPGDAAAAGGGGGGGGAAPLVRAYMEEPEGRSDAPAQGTRTPPLPATEGTPLLLGGRAGAPSPLPPAPPSRPALVWSRFVRWVLERKEREAPAQYGGRVPFRRVFLLLGFSAFTFLVAKELDFVLHTSVKRYVESLLASSGYHLAWPDASHGGGVLDPLFKAYSDARWTSLMLMLAALALAAYSLLIDAVRPSRLSLAQSRAFLFASLTTVFIASVVPMMPNYLRASNLGESLPQCAPEFDNVVRLLIGDLIGLTCSAVFAITLVPILLAVVPSMVRASKLMLCDGTVNTAVGPAAAAAALAKARRHAGALNADVESIDGDDGLVLVSGGAGPLLLEDTPHMSVENVRMLFAYASVLSPLLSGLPMIIFYQLLGDPVVAALFVLFWLLPIFVGFQVTSQNVLRVYRLWLAAYFLPVFAVCGYEVAKRGLARPIRELLQSSELYAEVVAEICLANVAVSDILYMITHRNV